MGIKKYTPKVLPPTLDELKAKKNLEIKSTLAQIRSEGFMTSFGFKIDCGERNVNDFANGLMMIQATNMTEIIVKDFDNQTHVLSGDDYKTMVIELGGYISKLLGNKWQLNELVKVATIDNISDIYWRNAITDEETLETTGYEYNPILGGE